MKKSCTLFLLLIFVVTLVVTDAEAQRFTERSRYASIGVNIGAMNYLGDIVPAPHFTSFRAKSTRPSIGVTYTYRLYPRVSVRGGFQWGRIMGDDVLSASVDEAENADRFRRNLSFRNDIKELSAVAVIDLFENRRTYSRRPSFVPYGFVGLSVFHHNPKAYYENGSRGLAAEDDIPTGWYALQPLGTEGQYVENGNYPDPYKRVQIAIPFGLGFRFRIDRLWDLGLEVGWRKTFTDYLDDASTGYAWKQDILNGGGDNPKAAAILSDRSAASGFNTVADPSGTPYDIVPGYGSPANTMRGDRTDDDWLINVNLSINYIIIPNTRRPKFR
ncbi:DUF6089 family protein [Pontibacter silvestris]|uniref:DUF6089 family protein n=1 Tax=Pontibacter silvestris TaxID=2305183 RepID=A0ABW4WUT4_9BACT|nr:DUF6089 family protein [Pontibacter silvestris]MCC9136398.1 DUF6089 family protein [Pontibacter silvestris]